jgi:hypothetical protein
MSFIYTTTGRDMNCKFYQRRLTVIATKKWSKA